MSIAGAALQGQSGRNDLTCLKGFESFVDKILAEHQVPGVAISIVKAGRVIYAQGFGFRDIKNGLKVNPHNQT